MPIDYTFSFIQQTTTTPKIPNKNQQRAVSVDNFPIICAKFIAQLETFPFSCVKQIKDFHKRKCKRI